MKLQNLSAWQRTALGWCLGLMSFLVTSFVLSLLYWTLSPLPPNIVWRNSSMSIESTALGTIIDVKAEFAVERRIHVSYARELFKQGTDETIVLPDGERIFEKGAHAFHPIYTLPMRLSPGTWCLRTVTRWQPSLSLVGHVAQRDEPCARVP